MNPRRLLLLILLLGLGTMRAEPASAQSGWFHRLDDNGNGYVEPDEISDRARGYLERFASESGIKLSRPVSIRRLEAAAQQYQDRRERGDSDDIPSASTTIKGFGAEPGAAVVPEFGMREIRYPYTQADLEQADETLGRYDRDDNQILDATEIQQARWRGASSSDSDLNGDGRLSRIELAQRYARERILEERAAMAIIASPSNGASSNDDREDRSADASQRFQRRSRRADRGSRSLAQSIVQRHDDNRNNILEPREMASVGIEVGKVDYDRDGLVDSSELAEFLFLEMDQQGNDLSELLPTWFFERDLDGDKQVDMSEFTDQWTATKAEEFASYDTNGDGIIIPDELLASQRLVGGKFSNPEAKVLLPRSVAVSEIQIDEDIVIGDLDVQVSITHTYASHLDGYLIGPDGERIELFSGVGGSDDHFDHTIFDDEAERGINRAKAPFDGSYQPHAIAKRQKGLSQYKDQSLKGVWQLMIRSSRSDRSGVLHEWSLIVEPSQDSIDRLAQ